MTLKSILPKRCFAASLSFCLSLACLAAPSVKSVTGKWTCYADEKMSLADCKEQALQGARIQALADEFGTNLIMVNTSIDQMLNGKEYNIFDVMSTSEVQGEWISDDGEPKYSINHSSAGLPIVTCEIKGKARGLSNEAPDFKTTTLRNGTEERFADNVFRHGDNMYVLFKAPVAGYLAIYLACADGNAYSLFPYASNEEGQTKLKGNKSYVLFDDTDTQFGTTSKLRMTTTDEPELNRLYVIFSPNGFYKAVDSASSAPNAPRCLSLKEFDKWLGKLRRNDPKLGVRIVNLAITPKE